MKKLIRNTIFRKILAKISSQNFMYANSEKIFKVRLHFAETLTKMIRYYSLSTICDNIQQFISFEVCTTCYNIHVNAHHTHAQSLQSFCYKLNLTITDSFYVIHYAVHILLCHTAINRSSRFISFNPTNYTI